MKPNFLTKRRSSRTALLLQAAALCVCSTSTMAAIVDGTITNLPIPQTTNGVYINVVTGTSAITQAGAVGWDLNPYGGTTFGFFWPSTPAASSGGIGAAAAYTVLAVGDTVSPASAFIITTGGTTGTGFRLTQSSYLGFRFFNEATGAINYGYARFATTGPNGIPATLVCYRYENTGVAIQVAACGPPVDTAPTLTYNPTTAAGVTFPGGAAGTANTTIAITSTGASGAGQSAVTGCTVTGAGAASFGPVTTTPANGIFNSATTTGSINLSCTRGAAAATASLACTETATPTVAGSPFTRTWALTCPAASVADVAPIAAVAPTTLTAGAGSVTPTIVTPAQGTGSTVFGCSIPATAPSNFAITSNATQTLSTSAAPVAIGLSCVPQAAATTATLTCTQTATPGPNPASATAIITCPAAAAVAPTLTYNPSTAAGVTFPTGGTGVGNASILITSSGAVGSGQTQVGGCSITGAGAAAFGAVTVTPAGGVFNAATTTGSIALSCTRGLAVATASLSCTETATPAVAGSPFTRTWALTCPAITPTVSAGTPSGTTITLPGFAPPGSTSTAVLTFTSAGNAAVLSCTATGAGFSVAPNPLNLAAGVPGSVTVTYTGSVPGTYTGNLTCSSTSPGGPFTYPLSITVGPALSILPVPAMGLNGTLLLILGAMGMGLLTLGTRLRG